MSGAITAAAVGVGAFGAADALGVGLASSALIGGTAFAGASSLEGANIQASAAEQAAAQQAVAEGNATAAQQQMFAQTQQNTQPFIQQGQGVIPEINALEGTGPGGAGGIMSTLQQLPGYQFANTQGLKSVENSATARGLGVSGAAQKGAASYSTGLANEYYNNLLTGLQNTETTGANAAAGLGQTAANVGQGIASTTVGAGNALAAGTLGAGQAQAGGLGSIGSLVYANSILSGLNQNAGQGGYSSGGIPTLLAANANNTYGAVDLSNANAVNTLTGLG